MNTVQELTYVYKEVIRKNYALIDFLSHSRQNSPNESVTNLIEENRFLEQRLIELEDDIPIELEMQLFLKKEIVSETI